MYTDVYMYAYRCIRMYIDVYMYAYRCIHVYTCMCVYREREREGGRERRERVRASRVAPASVGDVSSIPE